MKTRFFLFSLLLSSTLSVEALSYPTLAPPGEMTGGLYRTYFDNIFANAGSDCDTYGQVIGGFTSTGVPLCVSPVSSGLFLSGQTAGDTIRFNGTDWVRTNLIYNDATNIGIGKTNPSYLLDVNGVGAFVGFRLPTGAASGNVLVSDASGNAYWAASFSGTYSASGITGGTQDYMPKYGSAGNGLVLSQFFDNGTSIGVGTAVPSATVKMDIIGDILANSLRIGRGAGNIISNTVFGWSALGLNVSGSMNTVLGYSALGALTAGDGNIGIGNLAGSTFVSGNNNIFIGNNAQPNIGTVASNQLNIGGWIYGDSGNIGIGVMSPTAKLEVNGQIKIMGGSPGSGYVLVSDASGLANWQAGVPASTVNATNITGGVPNYITKFGSGGTGIFPSLFYESSGYIGLGNTNPGAELDISGRIRMRTGAGSGLVMLSDGSGIASWGSVTASTVAASGVISGVQGYVPYFGTGGNGLYSSLLFQTGGRIGIGNSAPNSTLDVTGTGEFDGVRITNGAANGRLLMSDATGNASWTGFIVANGLSISGATTGNTLYYDGTNWIANSNIFNTGGNIGIGTAAPGAKLEVNGQLKITGGSPGLNKILTSDALGLATWSSVFSGSTLATGITGGSSGYLSVFGSAGNGLYSSLLFQTGGFLGINSTAPAYTLQVNGTGSFSGFRLPTGSSNGYILMSDASGNASWQAAAGGISGGQTNYIARWISATTLGTGSIFDNGSQVGIGTTSLTSGAKLDVVGGDAYINGVRVGLGGGSVSTNTVVGNSALTANTTQTNNTAFGYTALTTLSGSNNAGFGAYALRYTVGARNAAFGVGALGNNLANAGGQNAALGYNAGYNLTAGDNNVFIGDSAGNNLTSGSSNIAIGAGASFGTGIGSNQLTIGNWIYGNAGNIGIGTAAPGAKLEVNGQLKITGGSPGLNKVLTSDATGLASWSNALSSLSGSFWSLSGNAITAADFFGTTNNQDLRFYTNNSQKMVLTSAGRLGIGVANPTTASLELSGSAIISGDITVQGRVITDSIVNRTVTNISVSGSLFPDLNAPMSYRDIGNDTTQSWNNLYLSGQVKIKGGSPGLNKILTSDALGLATWSSVFSGSTLATGITGGSSGYLSVFGSAGNGLYSSLLFQTGGRIGIGNSAPNSTLDVTGTGEFDGVRITNGAANGRFLMSDATGNASWSSGFSGSISASGITGGTQNYVSKFGTGGNGLYISQIYDNGTNIGIGTGSNLTTKLTIDSGINNDSGLRLARINPNSPLTTNGIVAIGIDGSGKILPISPISNIAVYSGVLRTTVLTPNPDLNTFNITYDFNRYFGIPGKQSFVVSRGDGPSYNGPYFKENGTDALCSITGTYGSPGAYDCNDPDPATGISASPANSFTMTAKGDTFGYQLALGARGDAPLFARSGRFNGSQTGGLYTNDSPYQTPAPWQRVLSVPANHPEYLYINTGLNSQLQAISGGGNVAIGTTTPASRFEVWTGATTTSLLHFRGTNNVGLGLGAVRTALSGNANTGIGSDALGAVTSGYSNTAIGYRALRLNAGGFNNTAIGQEALNTNNGGGWNTAGGYQTLYSNSSGTGNTANGAQALYNLSTGNGNTAFGFQALRVQAGSAVGQNVGIGYQTLYSTTASNLTAVGYQALYSNSSGTGNTAIGYQSMDSLTTGYNNTSLGYLALGQATGNQNVAIGANAGSSLTTGSNNIIIGAGEQAMVATGSNQLNIGDWIYGNGGNIGIGVTSPVAKLDVGGTFNLGTQGTTLNSIIKVTVSQNVPSIATITCSARTFAVTNAQTTGSVTISPATALNDRMIIAYARVSAAGTVEAKFCNESTAAIDLPSMNYYITVIQ